MISDRRLYLTADRRTVVEEGDPRAAYLLVAAGGTLDDHDARRLGHPSAAEILAGARPPVPKPTPAGDPKPTIPQKGPGLLINRSKPQDAPPAKTPAK